MNVTLTMYCIIEFLGVFQITWVAVLVEKGKMKIFFPFFYQATFHVFITPVKYYLIV